MSRSTILDKGTCPTCGAPLSDKRLGVCAACLLGIAAASGSPESPTPTATGSASAARKPDAGSSLDRSSGPIASSGCSAGEGWARSMRRCSLNTAGGSQ